MGEWRSFGRRDARPLEKANRLRVIRDIAKLAAKFGPLPVSLHMEMNHLSHARTLHIPTMESIVQNLFSRGNLSHPA